MRLKFYSKKAFTLAEALITFAILGVIAAMTIPGMILSMQKSEYVSGMKKSYTTLTNAVKKMNFANDMAEYKKFWSDETVFWNEFASQMRIMQICVCISLVRNSASFSRDTLRPRVIASNIAFLAL